MVFYQMIAGSYKSERPINFSSIDEVHLKCDCIEGSIVNGVREHILYNFALDKPAFQKILKEPKIKLLKKLNKSVLSHIRLYLEDDDHKEVDSN